MSYNPNVVRDDDLSVTIQGQKFTYSKKPAFQVMTEALVTRRFGGQNPFWVKGLDWGVPKAKWIWRNRKVFKYPPIPYPYETEIPKEKLPESGNSIPKGNQKRGSFKPRRSCKCYGKPFTRGRFCSCRTNKRYRRKRSYRKRYQTNRNTVFSS